MAGLHIVSGRIENGAFIPTRSYHVASLEEQIAFHEQQSAYYKRLHTSALKRICGSKTRKSAALALEDAVAMRKMFHSHHASVLRLRAMRREECRVA